MYAQLQEEIKKLKAQTNTAIVAHTYMSPEVLAVADVTGDSFVLSVEASKMPQDTVLMCGVRFMAETVKILSPQKKVILPVPEATCPMAEQISPARVRAFKQEHPEYAVVVYINTTAELKRECDVCVTSSSAVQIVKSLPQKDILFIPDANLGAYIQAQVPGKNILLWEGCCPIHSEITGQDVLDAKAAHPEAVVLMHPECPAEALKHADIIGSTSALLNYANTHEGAFVIGTEKGVYDALSLKFPDKQFYLLSKKLICPDMKIVGLPQIRNALLGRGGEEIRMEEAARTEAAACIDKMIELGS